MLLAINTLFDTIFGSILPAWLALDSTMYLMGIFAFAAIVSVIIKFFKRR